MGDTRACAHGRRRRRDGPGSGPRPICSRMRLTELGRVTLVVAVVAGVIAGLVGERAIGAIAACAVVLAGLVAAPFLARRVRSWGYCEREDDLLVRHGLLVARLSVVPYGRMQFIDVEAGPGRAARSGSRPCTCTPRPRRPTRASPGSSAAEAARLRDRLAALGEARAAGPVSDDAARRVERRLAPAAPALAVRPRRARGDRARRRARAGARQRRATSSARSSTSAILGVLVVLGFVSWLVTRWRVEEQRPAHRDRPDPPQLAALSRSRRCRRST